MEEKKKKDAALKQQFIDWIMNQRHDDYTVEMTDENHILLKSEYGTAQVNFYDDDLVEISITSAKDGENRYWLHFQLNDEEHARQLYKEMREAFISLKDDNMVKVLLSCSTGMTTSYFASKLNDAAKSLDLNFHFDAVSYTALYETAEKFDIVVLAPQIGYMEKKLKEALPEIPVVTCPAALFASYDTLKFIEFVEKELLSFKKKKQEKDETRYLERVNRIDNRYRILIIAIKNETAGSINGYYRVYDHGSVVLDDMVKKPKAHMLDLNDVIDTVIARFKKLDLIGIATPGIVSADGKVSRISRKVRPMDVAKYLEERYHIPAVICNNTNASAWAFHEKHPEFKNLIYHSQPYAQPGGGQGYIIDGKLHTGKGGLAGEFKFYIGRMQFSDNPDILAKTDQGMLELVTKALLAPITVLAPEAIAIRSRMTSDMAEIYSRLAGFIDPEFLPDLIYVPDDREDLLSGALSLSLIEFDKKFNPKS